MSIFKFKQFQVNQERSAMKIGTDGVLLGAWAGRKWHQRILDVGTGTGVVALMLAQRNKNAYITGIELDGEAALEAAGNFQVSPFNSRMGLISGDVLTHPFEHRFDLIVSNPPYFENALTAIDAQRTKARHTASLPFEKLLPIVADNLTENGIFAVIVPHTVEQKFEQIAMKNKLYCFRLTHVKGTGERPVKRSLMEFSFQPQEQHSNELIIEKDRHVYTSEYISLTREFYLNM